MASTVEYKSKLLSWIITIPFTVSFVLTLCIYHPFLLLSKYILPGKFENILHSMNKLLLSILKNIANTKFKTTINFDPEDLDNKNIILVCNHQSMFDIPLIMVTLNSLKPCFIAKKELGKWLPSISISLRTIPSALIERKNPQQALNEIRKLTHTASDLKRAVCIFPEGTRARNGILKKFKTRGYKLLREELEESFVIPVTINGSWKLLKDSFKPFPFGTEVTITADKPIPLSTPSEEIKNIREHILTSLKPL